MEQRLYNKIIDRIFKIKAKKEQFTQEYKMKVSKAFQHSNLELNLELKKIYSEGLPEIFFGLTSQKEKLCKSC
jgi:hypothetical protein